jgi:hypothetical protein
MYRFGTDLAEWGTIAAQLTRKMTTSQQALRLRLGAFIAAGAIAASAAAGAQAKPRGHTSPQAARAAIGHFAAAVARVTGARSYKVSGCFSRGSNVSCNVRWIYPDTGVACAIRAATYNSGGELKVRRTSGINCDSLDGAPGDGSGHGNGPGNGDGNGNGHGHGSGHAGR